MRVGRRLIGFLVLAVLALIAGPPSVYANEGAFVGADLGVSAPTNDNYSQHVDAGGAIAPYGGYMFNDYFGLLGQLHFNFQPPDVDGRKWRNACPPNVSYCAPAGSQLSLINNESQYTTIFGLTVGPRFNVPLFNHLFDLHADVQGGGFKGLGGRLNQWAPGFYAGGGLDFNVTPHFSVGAFGRWNRAYMSPHPYLLGESFTTAAAAADQQGPADIRWAEAGVSLRYSFFEEKPAPPPPPPPPPPAAAPVKKKIVLRAVHFDFDKSNIRRDAIPVLDEAVNVLKQEPASVSVICAGYTDSIGSDRYNMKLSMRRADAVKKYLVSKGIPASRIKVEGFGESNPVASNATAEGRAQNRRTELKLSQ